LPVVFKGAYSENAVYQKLLDLGLISKEEEDRKKHSSSSKLKLPVELPSIEETLKTLAAALKALENSELEKTDVLRLRGIISGGLKPTRTCLLNMWITAVWKLSCWS
jgi:hypothetical protein